jgi:integrase
VVRSRRNGKIVAARWDEIDVAAKVWVVPAKRMKAGKEHRVPLSERAIQLLAEVGPLRRQDGFIFPGRSGGQPLSEGAMTMGDADDFARGVVTQLADGKSVLFIQKRLSAAL